MRNKNFQTFFIMLFFNVKINTLLSYELRKQIYSRCKYSINIVFFIYSCLFLDLNKMKAKCNSRVLQYK